MNATSRRHEKIDIVALVIILSVSAVIAFGYFNGVDKPYYGRRLELHNQIIEGTALSPYRYRILVPFMAEFLTKAFSNVLSDRISFLLSYVIYDLLAVFFLLEILFLWLRTWFSREHALIGILYIASTIPIALRNHYFQPWSLLEAGLFSAALIAIHQKRYLLLVSLVMLASLNRETAVFIPLAFLLASLDVRNILKARGKVNWDTILIFGYLFLLWVVIFLGLRYFRGNAPNTVTMKELLTRNMTEDSLFNMFVNGSLFFGSFWVFICLGFRYAPILIKRIALIVPLYLIIVIVWGVWYEVRLLIPLYPVFVPLGLSFIFRDDLEKSDT